MKENDDDFLEILGQIGLGLIILMSFMAWVFTWDTGL